MDPSKVPVVGGYAVRVALAFQTGLIDCQSRVLDTVDISLRKVRKRA
jgi:hypothetical protein